MLTVVDLGIITRTVIDGSCLSHAGSLAPRV